MREQERGEQDEFDVGSSLARGPSSSLFILVPKTHHRVVRVRRRHRRGGLRGQLIELGRGDALVDARGDLLGDENLLLKREREGEREFFFDCRLPGAT